MKSQQPATGISNLSVVKLIGFLISLALVFGYSFLPTKQWQIFPNDYATMSLFSDKGATEVRWIDESQNHFECAIKKSDVFAFCGAALTWFEEQDEVLDLSGYQSMQIEIDKTGPNNHLRIFLYSKNEIVPGKFEATEPAHMEVAVAADELKGVTTVRLKDFRLAEWWLTQNAIHREFSHPQFYHVTSMGIGVPAEVYEPEQVKVKRIVLEGWYFSKESLYFFLLAFWALFLGAEGAVRFVHLRQRIKQDEARLAQLSDLSKKYKVRAETDRLTGLSNREGLAQTLSAIEKSKEKSQYGILLLDVDHFKTLNDNHGHDVGDKVLEELGQHITRCVRSTDLVSRWGGEEFVVLVRFANVDDLHPLAEKIRLEVSQQPFGGNRNLHITVSIGVAHMSVFEKYEDTFKRADTALYAAKRSGRNQVKLAQE